MTYRQDQFETLNHGATHRNERSLLSKVICPDTQTHTRARNGPTVRHGHLIDRQQQEQEALLWQTDRETRLSVEILQLRIIPFEKRLQSINDLEVYTLKVIAISAFR